MNPFLSAVVSSALLATSASAAPASSADAGTALSAAEAPEALPFIENDYPRALALAKKQGLPIFADAWAPW